MRRALAEWEEQEYLILALPHKNTDWKPYLDEILLSYAAFIQKVSVYQKILLIAPNELDFIPFKNFENVEFFKAPTNDTWIRDYAGIDIYDNDKIVALDFIFNAWGNKFQSELDNALNLKLYKDFFKTELKSINLILEGGSVDFNGKGTMLTTKKCLLNKNRNALSQKELDDKLKELFALKEIIWLENGFIRGDDTDSHIDILARFIDENTIAYCICEDKNDEHFKPLKAMEKELEKTAFKLVPLPLPKPLYYGKKRLGASYVNFVFINNALIVPFYNDENDEKVRKILASHLASRKIIELDARVFLRQNGSLHCACQNYFKRK